MAQWGVSDANTSSPIWGPAQLKKAPTATNRDALFGNTTADAFTTNETVGVYGVDATEIGVGYKQLTAVAANSAGTGGSYAPGDILSANNSGATFVRGAKVEVLSTTVRTVAINGLGSGYANADTVSLATGTATVDAVFTVTTGASNTSIASLALTSGGDYVANPTLSQGALKNVTVANSSANGATANVTMKISTLAISDPGEYSVAMTNVTANPVTGGSGTGATLKLTLTNKGSKGITHSGWQLRREGSGGRAGRVTYETLVAGGISTDASDDSLLPDL